MCVACTAIYAAAYKLITRTWRQHREIARLPFAAGVIMLSQRVDRRARACMVERARLAVADLAQESSGICTVVFDMLRLSWHAG